MVAQIHALHPTRTRWPLLLGPEGSRWEGKGASRRSLWIALAFTTIFMAFVLVRLGTPSVIYFDELHYVKAARILIGLKELTNPEHPLLGKTLIGAGMLVFGDNAWGWRLPAAFAGGLAFFSLLRVIWWARLSTRVMVLTGIFALTAHLLFLLSRIAMLDIFMIGFLCMGLWLLAAATRHGSGNHWRLLGAGIAFGLAFGSKWSAMPVMLLSCVAFGVARIHAVGWARPLSWFTARDVAPARGVSLIVAALLLGLGPLLVYCLTYLPAFFYTKDPMTIPGIWEVQQRIVRLHDAPMKPHKYMSVWYQWLIDYRPIWFMWTRVDGAQRGILAVGNPVVMYFGLVALVVGGVLAVIRRNAAMAAAALLFLAMMLAWVLAKKPVQFYYYYAPPSLALSAILALVLDDLWLKRGKWVVPAIVTVGAIGVFLFFFPILTAWALPPGKGVPPMWMWMPSWI